MSEIKEINSRAFDIVATLRETDHGLACAAADEIERLRAHVEALQQKIDADKSCACAYDSPDDVCLPYSPVVERLRAENAALIADNRTLLTAANEEATNLTEALRLMEPVAEAWNKNPLTPGTSCVGGVCAKDGEAIFDFVTRMRGE